MNLKNMKSRFLITVVAALLVFNQTVSVLGAIGDMGFFGGISEGERLPTTTELKVIESGSSARTQNRGTQKEYKEIIAIDGEPKEFEGLISFTSGEPDPTQEAGTYTVGITIGPSSTTGDTQLNRSITFQANWRKVGSQYVKTLTPTNWTETITVPYHKPASVPIITPSPVPSAAPTEEPVEAPTPTPTPFPTPALLPMDVLYTLDSRQSSLTISILEDHTPAITYYRGDTTGHLVYNSDYGKITVDINGWFSGYNCAWSKTETHVIDVTVMADDWQLQYQVRPSVTSNKEMNYVSNEATASFSGNYRELVQTQSWLEYNVFVKPNQYYYIPDSGSASINIANIPEQLISPSLNFLKGHPAEQDITKLFSMQILEGVEKYYEPAQAITRAQFTTAVVKAVKIAIEQPQQQSRSSRNQVVYHLFSDMDESRPEYPFIVAAYRAGITIGRDNASISPDDVLERQEAIAIMLRALGLDNYELDPTPITPFVDDYRVADWARKELYAAYRLGIIAPDENFEIHPDNIVSKAEAAALINRLIDYMRFDLPIDYTSHIVGYPG